MRTSGTHNGEPHAYFWRYLHQGGDACYEWPFYKTAKGYADLTANGRRVRAHILALEETVGPCPPGMEALHLCNNPSCWNPAHLRWGTHIENIEQRDREGRTARGERHGRSKLTAAQVDEIRQRYAQGDVSQQSLADEYGIAQHTVSRIVRGLIWPIKV